MRLKSFYGTTMTEAMRLVREALGDDAIIVATRDDENGGVRVTAAIDDPIEAPLAPPPLLLEEEDDDNQTLDTIARALVDHMVPATLSERLMATVTQYAQEDLLLSIGAALDTHFTYAPLPDDLAKRRLILIGPPGAGKTMCAAKLATKATMQKQSVTMISTDTDRAGAMAQLDAFARLLKSDMIEIEDPHALKDAVDMQKQNAFVIIDTAGCNPFDEAQKRNLAAMIKAADALPVLVLPADMDSTNALELALEFQSLGAAAVLATRLDMTRRLGGLLRMAYESKLPLCNFSASSKVTEAPQPFNPVSLARLILPQKQEPRTIATGTF